MPARVSTPTLDALRATVEQLGRAREISIEGLSEESALALGYLEDHQRPFLAVTATMQQAIVRYARQRLPNLLTRSGAVRIEEFWRGAGDAVKGVVLLRFREQGNDVGLRPLAPSTVYSKSHSRDPVVRSNATRVGVATGRLYNELTTATFRVEEV